MAIGLASVMVLLVSVAVGWLAFLGAQSRSLSVTLGVVDGRLRACPPTPNCVSSDAALSDSHYVDAIDDPTTARWSHLVEKVEALPGARLVTSSDDYAYFTFASRLFGFVDDVEFHRRPATGQIAVRSASRVGRGDLDANRTRVETIRAAL